MNTQYPKNEVTLASQTVSKGMAEDRRKEQAKWLSRPSRSMFHVKPLRDVQTIYQQIVYKMAAESAIENIEGTDCIVFDLDYVKVIKNDCDKKKWMLKDGVSGVIWTVGGSLDTAVYQILHRYYSFYGKF